MLPAPCRGPCPHLRGMSAGGHGHGMARLWARPLARPSPLVRPHLACRAARPGAPPAGLGLCTALVWARLHAARCTPLRAPAGRVPGLSSAGRFASLVRGRARALVCARSCAREAVVRKLQATGLVLSDVLAPAGRLCRGSGAGSCVLVVPAVHPGPCVWAWNQG